MLVMEAVAGVGMYGKKKVEELLELLPAMFEL
jgi:hypothetical protein